MSGGSSNDDRIGVPRLLLGVLWLAIVVAVPATGVWVASSLAAYRNGPVWLVSAAGLLLFPVLPLLWEGRSAVKWARRRGSTPRALTFTDRLVLRTLALNLVFLAVLLSAFPASTFAALATRGDWFLDGRSGPRVEEARAQLFQAASGLEWLYRKAGKNQYRDSLDPTARQTPIATARPEPARAERPVPVPSPPAPPVSTSVPAPAPEPEPPATAAAPDAVPPWPAPPTLHPLIAGLPAEAETSFLATARYVDAHEKDPWQRVKALHDYVADRVVYDVAALSGPRPPQDAATVFRTRKAVCAGYANLLAAMGNAIGEEIRVIAGDARLESGDLTGEGHAWNAARVDGRWVLVDATWDAGIVTASSFQKRYSTQYLFAPPEVMGATHFPEEASWQLREPVLTRGDFFRQPVLRAGFFADGLTLVSPDRSQVTVEKDVTMTLRNPRGLSLLAQLESAQGGKETECRVAGGADARIDCALPARGRYRLRLYAAREPRAWHPLVAEIEVNGTGG